jgi:hypothetical protein
LQLDGRLDAGRSAAWLAPEVQASVQNPDVSTAPFAVIQRTPQSTRMQTITTQYDEVNPAGISVIQDAPMASQLAARPCTVRKRLVSIVRWPGLVAAAAPRASARAAVAFVFASNTISIRAHAVNKRSQRNQLRTVRFSEAESARIEAYLERNPVFDSFSSVARVATLAFLGEERRFRLEPVSGERKRQRRPRFLWDYDLSDDEVKELLSQPGLSDAKRFLMERILSECRFEEVFEYVTLAELKRQFGKLSLPPAKKRHWGYALSRWSKDASRDA